MFLQVLNQTAQRLALSSQITVLQTKLKEKKCELQKLLQDLDETQKHCNQLQESAGKIMMLPAVYFVLLTLVIINIVFKKQAF